MRCAEPAVAHTIGSLQRLFASVLKWSEVLAFIVSADPLGVLASPPDAGMMER